MNYSVMRTIMISTIFLLLALLDNKLSNASGISIERDETDRLVDVFHAKKRITRQAMIGNPDNIGKIFYTSFFHDFVSAPEYRKNHLMLATDSPTPFTVTITTKDGLGSVVTKKLTIDNTQVHTVDVTVEKPVSAKISGDYDFAAYSFFIGEDSADGAMLFPLDVLDREYTIINGHTAKYKGFVYIIPTEDNTVIIVKSDSDRRVYKAKELELVYISFSYDSTGTKITSNKPVAVMIGNECLYAPDGCLGCDVVFEQLPPTKTHGTEYALTPFMHGPGVDRTCCINQTLCNEFYEFFKVLALFDGTVIQRFGSLTKKSQFKLNAGGWMDLLAGKDEYSMLKSSHPIAVLHIMQGRDYSGDTSDPSIHLVPPIDGYSKDYFIMSCNPSFTDHFLTVVIATDKASGLLMNGKPFLQDTESHPIPGSKLSAYQYKMQCSGKAVSLKIKHPDVSTVFMVTAYGHGTGNMPFYAKHSYSFVAGRLFGKSRFYCKPTPDTAPPDRVDNDCDGWVDEELRNFIDDDGDGRIDEDLAAVVPRIQVIPNVDVFTCEIAPKNKGAIDGRCQPANFTHKDIRIPGADLHPFVINRTWTPRDKCGNIGDNAWQIVTIYVGPDAFKAPPTVTVDDSDLIDDLKVTGEPKFTGRCPDEIVYEPKFTWTYTDTKLNETTIERIFKIQCLCLKNSKTEVTQILIVKGRPRMATPPPTTEAPRPAAPIPPMPQNTPKVTILIKHLIALIVKANLFTDSVGSSILATFNIENIGTVLTSTTVTQLQLNGNACANDRFVSILKTLVSNPSANLDVLVKVLAGYLIENTMYDENNLLKLIVSFDSGTNMNIKYTNIQMEISNGGDALSSEIPDLKPGQDANTQICSNIIVIQTPQDLKPLIKKLVDLNQQAGIFCQSVANNILATFDIQSNGARLIASDISKLNVSGKPVAAQKFITAFSIIISNPTENLNGLVKSVAELLIDNAAYDQKSILQLLLAYGVGVHVNMDYTTVNGHIGSSKPNYAPAVQDSIGPAKPSQVSAVNLSKGSRSSKDSGSSSSSEEHGHRD